MVALFMNVSEALEKVLPAFAQYYTINKDSPSQPFLAEAEFRSHNEQYFLVRSAHIADIDSNEFVYFATLSDLTNEKLDELVNTAWNLHQKHGKLDLKKLDLMKVIVIQISH